MVIIHGEEPKMSHLMRKSPHSTIRPSVRATYTVQMEKTEWHTAQSDDPQILRFSVMHVVRQVHPWYKFGGNRSIICPPEWECRICRNFDNDKKKLVMYDWKWV